MSSWATGLLVGAIAGLALSPFILLFAWLPMRRKAVDEEVSDAERLAVLRNTGLAFAGVVIVTAAAFVVIRGSGTPVSSDAMPGGSMPVGAMPAGTSGDPGSGMPGGMPMGSGGAAQVSRLPSKMAGMSLVRATSGDEALQQIASMHPSELPVDAAAIGEYSGDGHNAMVWFAVVPSAQMGSAMSGSMAQAIASGDTPFGVPKQMGGGLWRLEGMGQVHYFFPSGAEVWWVSADGSVAAQTLQRVQAAAGA